MSPAWLELLQEEVLFNDSFHEKYVELTELYQCTSSKVCPRQMIDVFAFTRSLEPNEVKVVLVGQDPYPNQDHANGLAFSCKVKSSSLTTLESVIKQDCYNGKDA